MTRPATTPRFDALRAARRRAAAALADLTEPVARYGPHPLVGSDDRFPEASGGERTYASGWVAIGETDQFRPTRDPSNHSTSSVTLGMRGTWAAPNPHNTASFPLLIVRVWADATRNGAGMPSNDAAMRCEAVGGRLEQLFHDPLHRRHWWVEPGDPTFPDGVYVISSLVSRALNITDVPVYDSVVMGEIRVNLELG